MSFANQLSTLLLPSRCVICQRFPFAICDQCWQTIPIGVRSVSKNRLNGIAITEYSADTANLINAFKEHGHRVLGEKLTTEIVRLWPRPDADLLLAAPSSPRNFAARGFVPAEVIAKTLSRSWGIPVDSLNVATRLGDQAELNRSQRLSNRLGSMSARRPLDGRRVLLIDDIVTTGATLSEMARAATEAGGLVLGFITVAETIPKTRTKI